MARKRVNMTKIDIVQVATKMFLEKGFSETSAKSVCEELEISTGNLTFYYPTKEHLLAVLVDMLCDFQWRTMERHAQEGKSSLLAVCLEFAAMASICEEDAVAKDLYLSAYTHPMTLDTIRRNDTKKEKLVFGQFCNDWSDDRFTEVGIIVSGIEYATLMSTEYSIPLYTRISSALESIMILFGVPEELRQKKIEKVLAMNYREIGRTLFKDFIEYVENFDEQMLEEALRPDKEVNL